MPKIVKERKKGGKKEEGKKGVKLGKPIRSDHTRLLAPFRAIGLVSGPSPFSVQERGGKECYLTVPAGRCVQIFNASNLRLLFSSTPLPLPPKVVACHEDLTLVSQGPRLAVLDRAKFSHTIGDVKAPDGGLKLPLHQSDIVSMVVLGEHVVTVSGADGRAAVWWIRSGDLLHEVPLGRSGGTATCMAHPDTYLNKVVIGTERGTLEIWNVKTAKLVHRLACVGGARGSPVVHIEQSTALDVVCVCFADGAVRLVNLRADAVLCTFRVGGVPTSSSFSRGGGVPVVAVSTDLGAVHVFDLDARVLRTSIQPAHGGRVTRCAFLGATRVLATASGDDNALREWVFDASDGSGRLLREREGHSGPVTIARFHPGSGLRLLTASTDGTMRMHSVHQDHQSRRFGSGGAGPRTASDAVTMAMSMATTGAKPAIASGTSATSSSIAARGSAVADRVQHRCVVAFASAAARERDWPCVVTCHADATAGALAWRTEGKGSLSKPLLLANAERPNPRPPTACAVSHCGSYGIVGTASGWVDIYAMQSGRHVRSIARPRPGTTDAECHWDDLPSTGARAHSSAVVGIAVDVCNRYMFTAARDGDVAVWDFAQCVKPQVAPQHRSAKRRRAAAAAASASGGGGGGGRPLLVAMLDTPASIGVPLFELHRKSGLLAVAFDDLSVRVYDAESLKCVRRMGGQYGLHAGTTTIVTRSAARRAAAERAGRKGSGIVIPMEMVTQSTGPRPSRAYPAPTGRVLALAFTPDARQVIASTSCAQMLCWDVPTGRLVDWAVTPRPAVALTFDPSGTFLATAHTESGGAGGGSDGGGVMLWTRRDRYMGTASGAHGVPGYVVPTRVEVGPALATDAAADVAGDYYDPRDLEGAGEVTDPDAGGDAQLFGGMITLSGLPPSVWRNLNELDDIKERNRPTEAPKAPEPAPFFLETAMGLSSPFFIKPDTQAGQGQEPQPESRLIAMGATPMHTEFIGALRTAHAASDDDDGSNKGDASADLAAADYSAAVTLLRGMNPSAIDLEIQSVSAESQWLDLRLILAMVRQQMRSGRNAELVQALLSRVIQVHGDVLADVPALARECARVLADLEESWGTLSKLLDKDVCLVNHYTRIDG